MMDVVEFDKAARLQNYAPLAGSLVTIDPAAPTVDGSSFTA